MKRWFRWKRFLILILGLATVYLLGVWALLAPEGPSAERFEEFNAGDLSGTDIFPGKHWERVVNPAEFGFDQGKLSQARSLCPSTGAAAVVVVYDGRLLLTWGFPSRRYPCHSIRKSLLSSLYGQAAAEGKVDLNHTLEQLGIDDHTPLTKLERQARVSDLLCAKSGIYLPSNNSSKEMQAKMPRRGGHPPGTFWFYNNWDFNALGTVYRNATGKTVFEAFGQQIAEPIGMEHFDSNRHTLWSNDGSSVHSGYEFKLSALDLARFGLLYSRGGRWGDRQLIPADWVKESTSVHSIVDGGPGGYGYMWWVENLPKYLPEYSKQLEGSYSAEGIWGHCVVVIPKCKIVVVVRVDTRLPPWMPMVAARGDKGNILGFLRTLLEAKS